MQADDLVGVKLFKLKLMSNIITHTIKELPEGIQEARLIVKAFL